MASLDATALENLHGNLLRSEACKELKVRALYNFLQTKGINTTEGQVRYWIQKNIGYHLVQLR